MTLTDYLAQLRAEREAKRLAQEAEELANLKAEIEQRMRDTRQCLEQMLGNDFELVKPHLHDEAPEDETETHYSALRLEYNDKSVWFSVLPKPSTKGGEFVLRYNPGYGFRDVHNANDLWSILLDL